MYNEELKMDVIKQKCFKGSISSYVTLFNAASSFEEKLQKDLSNFTNDEIIELLNSFDFTHPQSVRDTLAEINKYKEWRGTQPHSVTKDDVDFAASIRRTLYDSAHSLIMEIQNAVGLDEGFYVVPALCFAWIGISLEDAGQVPYDGIDFVKGVIYNPSGSVIASFSEPEITEALLVYSKTTEAIRTQNRTFTVRPLFNEKFLHLMVTHGSKKIPKPLSRKDIMREATILKEKAKSTRMTYSNILKSGKLNRLYRLEKSGIDVYSSSNHDIVQQIFADKNNVFDNLFLYRKYKEAFNLQ